MRDKKKYIIIFFITLMVGIVCMGIIKLLPSNEQKVKGKIEVLVNDDVYEYLLKCADKFMQVNDKAIVSIKKIENKKGEIQEEIDKSVLNKSEIIEANRMDYESLNTTNIQDYNENKDIVNTYSKNFSDYRINQVIKDDKIIGIPLTSRPLALYVRDDMLSKYGYSKESFNTWDDVITIGKDIYEKSNGKVRIINATGQDYNDLVDLIIMQNLVDDTTENIKLAVEAKIKELKDNNILNLQDGGEFLARISSINAMREIMELDVPCEWSCINVPSNGFGANKFFASEGSNLIVINQTNDNEKLITKFMTYVITNNKEAVDYVKEGEFFSSYLYTYKNKNIEEKVKNFSEKSPLVVLSNIEEKAPVIENYDKYLEVKTQLRMN